MHTVVQIEMNFIITIEFNKYNKYNNTGLTDCYIWNVKVPIT